MTLQITRNVTKFYLLGEADNAPFLFKDKPALKMLGKKFEKISYKQYQETLDDDDVELIEPVLEDYCKTIFEQVFRDKINWGRIIGILVFSSKLCTKLILLNKKASAINVANLTIDCLTNQKIITWIEEHNRLDSVVEPDVNIGVKILKNVIDVSLMVHFI